MLDILAKRKGKKFKKKCNVRLDEQTTESGAYEPSVGPKFVMEVSFDTLSILRDFYFSLKVC